MKNSSILLDNHNPDPLIADPYIRTVTGGTINFNDPQDFNLEDIATGLSNACRFAGQTRHFFSVAQHCCMVSERCKTYPLEGLLHDAVESFICDLPSPLKTLLPDYKKIEGRLAQKLAKQFNAIYPWPEEIHRHDHEQYFWERDNILTLTYDQAKQKCWSHEQARYEWLMRFQEVGQ